MGGMLDRYVPGHALRNRAVHDDSHCSRFGLSLAHLIHRTSWPQCHYVYTTDMYTPRRRLT